MTIQGALTMSRPHLLAYGIIAGVTPILVFMNTVLITAASPSPTSVQPIHPIMLAPRLMNSEPETLVTADDFRPDGADRPPQAHIIEADGQVFLEFYSPFHSVDPAPDLTLVLDQQITSGKHLVLSHRHYTIGKLQAAAGHQRYSIPASVEVGQYLSVVVWWPELGAILGYVPLVVEGKESSNQNRLEPLVCKQMTDPKELNTPSLEG
jgi:hypothetical protein